MTLRMAGCYGAGCLAALLSGTCFFNGAPTTKAVALGQNHVQANRIADAVIPEWRVDQVLTPLHSLGTHRSEEIPPNPSQRQRPLDFSSTPAQDQGRCPLVKLPEIVALHAKDTSATGQSGIWETSNNVELSSWRQSFLSRNWKTMNIRNLDQRLALQASIISEEDLEFMFDWKVGFLPMDYPVISRLENVMLVSQYNTRFDNMASALAKNDFESASDPLANKSPETWTTAPILDCDGRLLFVVRLLKPYLDGLPGGIDIYDRNGRLVAHALTDPKVARYQFIDTKGYLLATAEAPGLNLNVSKEDLPRDPSRGNILPYAISFEPGGYANASQLLDVDHRWAIAAAVQLRATHDAQAGWKPGILEFLVAIYWLIAILVIVFVICACIYLHRLVYPRRKSTSLGPTLVDKQSAMRMPHAYQY